MAQNTRISCPTAAWTQLTDADTAGDISVALIKGPVLLQATADATPPTGVTGFPLTAIGDGWSEATIVEKFPGVAGAVRLWAYPDRSDSAGAIVQVSHG